MTARTGYLHADTPYQVELDRLRLLEARYDEVTRTRLDIVGPLDGLSCLEVGAGAGSVALMLTDAVGPDGEVVALDLDPRFLQDLHLPNLTVRQHDLVADELERSRYDLVHCRALLCHLSDPVSALQRMVAALRPGGLLLVEDADYASFHAPPDHPSAAEFNRILQIWTDGQRVDGRFDPLFGSKLPGLLDELGLVERGDEALRFVRVGGSPTAEFYARAIEAIRDGALAASLPAGFDFDGWLATVRDPEFRFVDSLNVAAWGRRPLPGFLG